MSGLEGASAAVETAGQSDRVHGGVITIFLVTFYAYSDATYVGIRTALCPCPRSPKAVMGSELAGGDWGRYPYERGPRPHRVLIGAAQD